MALGRFVEQILERVRGARVDLAGLRRDAIAGSIFDGATGVAFFLHEAARLRGDDALLDRARAWYALANDWSLGAARSDWKESPNGFLIGEAGVAYVGALLAARAGDRAEVLAAAERLEGVALRPPAIRPGSRATEMLAGAAGVVRATGDLDRRLPSDPAYDAARSTLSRVRERAAASLVAAYATPLPLGPDDRVGVAHGVAGELLALADALGVEHPTVRARLGELAAARKLDEEGLAYWLPSAGWRGPVLASWCGGMAGQTLLWCEIARRSDAAEWTALARASAETTAILFDVSPTLCCGLAGQAIALGSYADLSADRRFAKRAYDRLARATALAEALGDGELLCLWQGTLGVALAALWRLHGERAFPCVEAVRGTA